MPLKIRLPETLRHQLLIGAGGRPFNRLIVDRLEADSRLNAGRVDFLPGGHVSYGENTLGMSAALYRDLNAVIRALSNVGMILVPGSTFLCSVRPRSAAHRSLEGARVKIRGALDIVLTLPPAMADYVPSDTAAQTAAAPLRDRLLLTTDYDAILERAAGRTYELLRQSGWPREERNPSDIVEVKVRLPEILRQRLAAEASHNKRTLTAEIRARLELFCAFEIFKRAVGGQIAEIVNAAVKEVSSLREWRMVLTTDKLYMITEALETAQAVLNPLSGFLRRVRSKSGAARELEDARNHIRTALLTVQRLVEGGGRAGAIDQPHSAIG